MNSLNYSTMSNKNKDLLTKIIKVVLYNLLAGTIIYSIVNFGKYISEDETLKLNLKGKLDSKYLDTNYHNRPCLKIKDREKIIVYDIATDESGLFEYIQKGDSIIKLSNSLNVRVSNSQKDTIFVLKF